MGIQSFLIFEHALHLLNLIQLALYSFQLVAIASIDHSSIQTDLLSYLLFPLLFIFLCAEIWKILFEVRSIVLSIGHLIECPNRSLIGSSIIVDALADSFAGDGPGALFAFVATLAYLLEQVLNIHNFITAISHHQQWVRTTTRFVTKWSGKAVMMLREGWDGRWDGVECVLQYIFFYLFTK